MIPYVLYLIKIEWGQLETQCSAVLLLECDTFCLENIKKKK